MYLCIQEHVHLYSYLEAGLIDEIPFLFYETTIWPGVAGVTRTEVTGGRKKLDWLLVF